MIEILLNSEEPAVRLKAAVDVLGQDPYGLVTMLQREQMKASPRVQRLLSERDADGRIPYHPYSKWRGAHWVLVCLAELGYPSGDESLLPLRDQVFGWLLGKDHERHIETVNGRVRRCASQEGNALYAALVLGLADSRVEELVQRLISWQWPDGGWNCDRRPEAAKSSFMETLIPARGLAWHGKFTGSGESIKASRRAAGVFLRRNLFRRQSDGSVIEEDFTRLHHPCYWHYDILFALKVLAEAGFIVDRRCDEALDLLESKRLADDGWPAEGKYYHVARQGKDGPTPARHISSGSSLVDWGPTGKRRMNEFVTADALYVLKAAGRLPQPVELPPSYEG